MAALSLNSLKQPACGQVTERAPPPPLHDVCGEADDCGDEGESPKLFVDSATSVVPDVEGLLPLATDPPSLYIRLLDCEAALSSVTSKNGNILSDEEIFFFLQQ